jgi:hypothetical protein
MTAESDETGNSSDVGAGGDETGKGGSRGDIGAAITGGTNMGAFVWSEKKLKLVDIFRRHQSRTAVRTSSHLRRKGWRTR